MTHAPPHSPDITWEPDVRYEGDYPDFATALSASNGYQSAVILERTRLALHKVLRGEAAYERDAVTFDHLELPYPLLTQLLKTAATANGRLSVLDFGGSLGSTYFQCRSFLQGLPQLEWSIVEQPAHVACGQREFQDDTLKFYPTIDSCMAARRPNLLLLSGVLQCLPEPWSFFQDVTAREFETIVIDRTPFIDSDQDRLTVEIVSPRIYPASYPAWFFSRRHFDKRIPEGWTITNEFPALDRQLLDGIEIVYRGFGITRTR